MMPAEDDGNQLDLFGGPQSPKQGLERVVPGQTDKAHFSGPFIDPKKDDRRLTGQLKAVWDILQDRKPHTLPELQECLGLTMTTSISARIRDLRKKEFGSHDVLTERVSKGLYRYTLLDPPEEDKE